MAKNAHVHEGRKVGRSNATPTKLFSVNSYDLKFMSLKFGNDIFITFEKPRYIHKVQAQEIKFLLFRPSVIRGPCIVLHTRSFDFLVGTTAEFMLVETPARLKCRFSKK